MRLLHILCLTTALAAALALLAACGRTGPVERIAYTPEPLKLYVGNHVFYWDQLRLVEAGSQVTVVVGDVRLVDDPPDSGRPYRGTVLHIEDRSALMEYFADIPSAKAWVEARVREWYSEHQ